MTIRCLGDGQASRGGRHGRIVLKAHYWPTGALAQTIQHHVPNIILFDMNTIPYQYEYLNPFVVEIGARLGCKILMTPTSHTRAAVATAHRQGREVSGARRDQDGMSLVDPIRHCGRAERRCWTRVPS